MPVSPTEEVTNYYFSYEPPVEEEERKCNSHAEERKKEREGNLFMSMLLDRCEENVKSSLMTLK